MGCDLIEVTPLEEEENHEQVEPQWDSASAKGSNHCTENAI